MSDFIKAYFADALGRSYAAQNQPVLTPPIARSQVKDAIVRYALQEEPDEEVVPYGPIDDEDAHLDDLEMMQDEDSLDSMLDPFESAVHDHAGPEPLGA